MCANLIHCFNEQMERDKGMRRVLVRKEGSEGMAIGKILFPVEFQQRF
jgi:hypothetical protein